MSARPTRRQVLAAVSCATALGALSACAARSEVLPQGWDRVLAHGARVPVRSQWAHRAAPDDVPLWTDVWVSEDASVHLLVGPPTVAAHEEAVQQARAALRAALPGYAATTSVSTADGDGHRLSAQDFTTRAPGFEEGRMWVLSGEESVVAVALAATSLSRADCDVVVAGLRLLPGTGAGSAPQGWARAGRGDLTVLVPTSWRVLGPVPGSRRWTDSWADADPDGVSRARLLLCADTAVRTRQDALARIESDSVAGAVPGYRAVHDHEVQAGAARATRRDFTFRGGTGALWVVETGDGVGAVQLTVMDTALAASPDVVREIEEGLWVVGHDR